MRLLTTIVSLTLFCLAGIAKTQPALASAAHTGPASVIDGQTLEIAGTRFKLHGIDAPEAFQRCRLPDGVAWFCGRAAAVVMVSLVVDRRVLCSDPEPASAGSELRLKCQVGSLDLGLELVRRGLAWPAPRAGAAYQEAYAAARKAALGVFRGPRETPAEFRLAREGAAKAVRPDGCTVKGNVDAEGRRIYHMPWSQWYDVTTITAARGERWFCSEAEARAAGWRDLPWDGIPRFVPEDMPEGGVLTHQR